MKSKKEQVTELLKCIGKGVYEKEHILSLSLLCCVAGESIFLLGPPGTAKSMVARRLKEVFNDGNAFEYLMSRFSTPDEIFGPVSITKLKDEDVYERCVDGFLPTATVVFLDEIWKAGPAIQNALLTVINERIYQNGRKVIQLPMKMLIAASNELPAEDEGLEALWDRFLVRAVSNCISNEKTFYRMLCQKDEAKMCVPTKLKISDKQYREWQEEASKVQIGDDVLGVITEIRKRLAKAADEEGANAFDFYISDRRWRKIAQLLQMSALLNDREQIERSDLLLLRHILWNNTEVIGRVWQVVNEALFADIEASLLRIGKNLEQCLKSIPAEESTDEKSFKLYNYFFYNLIGYPNARCYLYAPDYKYLKKTKDTEGLLYWDNKMNTYCVRRFETTRPLSLAANVKVDKVKLRRSGNSISIDNRWYVLESLTPFQQMSQTENENKERCRTMIEELQTSIGQLKQTLSLRTESIVKSDNLFVSKDDSKQMTKHAEALNKRIEEMDIKIINAVQLTYEQCGDTRGDRGSSGDLWTNF